MSTGGTPIARVLSAAAVTASAQSFEDGPVWADGSVASAARIPERSYTAAEATAWLHGRDRHDRGETTPTA